MRYGDIQNDTHKRKLKFMPLSWKPKPCSRFAITKTAPPVRLLCCMHAEWLVIRGFRHYAWLDLTFILHVWPKNNGTTLGHKFAVGFPFTAKLEREFYASSLWLWNLILLFLLQASNGRLQVEVRFNENYGKLKTSFWFEIPIIVVARHYNTNMVWCLLVRPLVLEHLV